MKKLYTALLSVFLLSLFVYMGSIQIEPYAKKWIVKQLAVISSQNNIKITNYSILVRPLLLKAVFKTPVIHIGRRQHKKSFQFNEISVELNTLRSILRRQLTMDILIQGFKIKESFVYNSKSSVSKNPLQDLKKGLNQKILNSRLSFQKNILTLPIYKLSLKNTALSLNNLSGEKIVFKNLNLDFKNKSKALHLKAKGEAVLKENKAVVQSEFTVDPHQIRMEQMIIQSQSSHLSFHGYFNAEQSKFLINSKVSMEFKDTAPWLKWTKLSPPYFPEQGSIKLHSVISNEKKSPQPFEISASELKWKNILISELKTYGEINRSRIFIKMAHIEKPGQTFFFENAKVKWKKDWSFKTKIYSQILDFQKAQKILGWNSDFHFSAPIEAQCQGRLSRLEFNCRIQGNLKNISLAEEKSSPIFESPGISLTSQVSWTPKKTSFKGSLFTKNKSDIKFSVLLNPGGKTQIPFKGELSLSDIKSLVGHDINGMLSLDSGKLIVGADNKVSIFSETKAKNFSFSGYFLDQFESQITITQNDVIFNSIKGNLKKSIYEGNAHIFLNRKNPRITAEAKFSPFHLENLQHFTGDNLIFPAKLEGRGQAVLSLKDSPLDIQSLNYTLLSSFLNVKISDESFQDLNFNISSKKGKTYFDDVLFKKVKGQVKLTGFFTPSWKMNAGLIGENLILEQSETLKQWLNPFISSNFQFTSRIGGSLNKPKLWTAAQLKNTTYKNEKLKASDLDFYFDSRTLKGKGSFFNNRLQVKNFLSRGADQNKTLSVDFSTQDWNFIPFLDFMEPSSSIFAKVSANGSLHFPLKSPLNLSGSLDVQSFSLRQEKNETKLTEPFSVLFNNGEFKLKNSPLRMKSNNKDLIFTQTSKKGSHRLQGAVRLELIPPLLAFIEDSRGEMEVDIEFNNFLTQLNPKGTVKIKNAVLNLTRSLDIFQPFSLEGRIDSKQFIVESFNAQTASGELSGSGKVNYSHKNILPLSFKGQFRQMVFHISDQSKIKGSGVVKFFGDKAPYLLSGSFFLNEGFLKNEFEETQLSDSQAEISSFTAIPDKKAPAFLLDLFLDLKKPLVIENSLISSLITGSVKVTGPFQSPLASGMLHFSPGGKLYFRDYEFEITKGQINYNKEPFSSPRLSLIGETDFKEIQYSQNRQVNTTYKIRAEVERGKNTFDIKLTSQPSLSEPEILSMMALGARSVEFIGNTRLSNAARYSYSQIGYALFKGIIGQDLSNLLGIRFSISPFIDGDQNRTTNKFWVHKKWSDNLSTSMNTTLDNTDRTLNIEYNLTPKISLLGMWINKEQNEKNDPNILSLDFEYKWDF